MSKYPIFFNEKFFLGAFQKHQLFSQGKGKTNKIYIFYKRQTEINYIKISMPHVT